MPVEGTSAEQKIGVLPFPASVVLMLSTAPLRVRVILVAAASLVYAAGFVGLFPLAARSGIGLAILPIIVAAVSLAYVEARWLKQTD